MNYIGELSFAWLVIVALYAVVPASVDARALDGDTFITDRVDNSPNENEDNDIDNNLTITEGELYSIVEMALESYLNSKNGQRKQGASSLWFRPIDNLANGFTGNYKRSLSDNAVARDYARAALKRNMREGLRYELAKKSYHSPIDRSGGSMISNGLISGVGR